MGGATDDGVTVRKDELVPDALLSPVVGDEDWAVTATANAAYRSGRSCILAAMGQRRAKDEGGAKGETRNEEFRPYNQGQNE